MSDYTVFKMSYVLSHMTFNCYSMDKQLTQPLLPRSKVHVTVNEVKQAITRRINGGLHPRSSQLPSVRTLADELRANRNTVNKAYRQLSEMGIIELSPSETLEFSNMK